MDHAALIAAADADRERRLDAAWERAEEDAEAAGAPIVLRPPSADADFVCTINGLVFDRRSFYVGATQPPLRRWVDPSFGHVNSGWERMYIVAVWGDGGEAAVAEARAINSMWDRYPAFCWNSARGGGWGFAVGRSDVYIRVRLIVQTQKQ